MKNSLGFLKESDLASLSCLFIYESRKQLTNLFLIHNYSSRREHKLDRLSCNISRDVKRFTLFPNWPYEERHPERFFQFDRTALKNTKKVGHQL